MAKISAELHAIFCKNQREFQINRTTLKAIAQVESSWQPRAYRFEPELFKRLKEKDPYWADKDPSIVSASYGYMQVLFTTAWVLGLKPANWKKLTHAEFQELAESLYDPATSVMLAAKLLRQLLNKIWADGVPQKYEGISAMDIALARYNGGSWKNPDEHGGLRNQKYVNKVWRAHEELKPKETGCDKTIVIG